MYEDNHYVAASGESLADENLVAKFNSSLDTLLIGLVQAVSDVKRIIDQHMKEEYCSTTSTVAGKSQNYDIYMLNSS